MYEEFLVAVDFRSQNKHRTESSAKHYSCPENVFVKVLYLFTLKNVIGIENTPFNITIHSFEKSEKLCFTCSYYIIF